MIGTNDNLRPTKYLYFYKCSECHSLVRGLICQACGKKIEENDIYQYELKRVHKIQEHHGRKKYVL